MIVEEYKRDSCLIRVDDRDIRKRRKK